MFFDQDQTSTETGPHRTVWEDFDEVFRDQENADPVIVRAEDGTWDLEPEVVWP